MQRQALYHRRRLSKAYQKVTGIAGYTLVYNSYGLLLVAHDPFVSVEEAVRTESDIHSQTMVVERTFNRLTVADTDAGMEIPGADSRSRGASPGLPFR